MLNITIKVIDGMSLPGLKGQCSFNATASGDCGVRFEKTSNQGMNSSLYYTPHGLQSQNNLQPLRLML